MEQISPRGIKIKVITGSNLRTYMSLTMGNIIETGFSSDSITYSTSFLENSIIKCPKNNT